MSEENTTDTRSAFEQWLRRAHSPAHARRTAARNAAFLLPHLRPGMRLLDGGCGPGSITIGLAEAVAPGEVIGIDASTAAIDDARAAAPSKSCSNIRFEVADVYALPYDDASFDAVFSHAVMQHLREPARALRELRRVLRPGGIIGVADADHDGSIIAPSDPRIDASMQLLRRLREAGGGGDPRVGKHLRSLLHEAGFARCEATATAGYEGAAVPARMTGEFWARYFESPQLISRATELGLADRDGIADMASAWRAWGQHPGAFWARFACEAIACAD
ncbi:MAG: methyltransferase domain-containing protein [Chloroflexota bacterium]|nr:methyltransferase domain-containing protein [Chloroflexota bacterium]